MYISSFPSAQSLGLMLNEVEGTPQQHLCLVLMLINGTLRMSWLLQCQQWSQGVSEEKRSQSISLLISDSSPRWSISLVYLLLALVFSSQPTRTVSLTYINNSASPCGHDRTVSSSTPLALASKLELSCLMFMSGLLFTVCLYWTICVFSNTFSNSTIQCQPEVEGFPQSFLPYVVLGRFSLPYLPLAFCFLTISKSIWIIFLKL